MFAMAKSLNRYREEKYMNVREFVDFLGITNTTFYKIIKGQRPRFTTMRKIATKLEVHPSDISEFEIKKGQDDER